MIYWKFCVWKTAIQEALCIFTGTLEQAKKYIDLGFYISFSGVITFPPLRRASANSYEEVVKIFHWKKYLLKPIVRMSRQFPIGGKKRAGVCEIRGSKNRGD